MRNSEEKPIRLCVANIGKTLGIQALLERHMDKLPRTAAYIRTTVETDMGFRLRRIEWARWEMEKDGKDMASWRILKKAGVRKEFINEMSIKKNSIIY